MNKRILLFFSVSLFVLISCRTTKNTHTIQTAITKKDTTKVVTIAEVKTIDSVAIVKEILSKVVHNKINFNTFYAKVKVDYESPSDEKKFTAYIYMQKDSVIYLRLVGNFLGITKEGVVAKITRDSVIVVNKIEKVVQKRTLAYLQDVTQIPFDFYTIQDVLIGNPVFLDTNIISFKNNEEKFSILMFGTLFKNLLSLDKNNFTLLHSKLDDIDIFKNRTCNLAYSNYENISGNNFSTERKISVSEKSKLDIWLSFKQYTFNEPLTYMFNIPKNYKKQ
ncbi:MAG: DUF4292 domain-containing protein [Chitinophagales bacterium]|nr:DUF4292 domain-containing protein [Chitinophagales bacterium]